MRYVSKGEGEGMIASGQASSVLRDLEHGKPYQTPESRLIGFTLRVPVRPPDPGQPMLKKNEMLANAGVYGSSSTARLSEKDKLQHMRKTRFPDGIVVETPETEDFVELAEVKVGIWAAVGDDRAVRVGPRIDARAIQIVEALDYQRRLYPNP